MEAGGTWVGRGLSHGSRSENFRRNSLKMNPFDECDSHLHMGRQALAVTISGPPPRILRTDRPLRSGPGHSREPAWRAQKWWSVCGRNRCTWLRTTGFGLDDGSTYVPTVVPIRRKALTSLTDYH